jgi:hypothetical protein
MATATKNKARVDAKKALKERHLMSAFQSKPLKAGLAVPAKQHSIATLPILSVIPILILLTGTAL